jgi:Domain of unknown function (DUF4304)
MKSDAGRLVDAALRSQWLPVLRNDGFRPSGRTFRRVHGDVIHVINIQGSRYGGQFAVNMGVHLSFLPDVLGAPVKPKAITEPQCEFRRRLAVDGVDQWWAHGSDQASIVAAIGGALDVYERYGRKQFGVLGAFPESFAAVTPSSLQSGATDLGGFRSPLVRMCLVFSRIRLHEGAKQSARQFAELGLANLGQASALRAAFETVRGAT